MLRLTLEGHEIDLYEDVSVNLTLQFTDVQNINSPAGSFSQTFRVPATPNNLDYFGPINDTTAVGVSNVKQRIPAQLLRDSIPLISGFCQIKAVYLQKEKYADIELVFFGGAVDLKSAVGDGMLSDLDLSSLDHELNRTNLENSWTASTGIAPYIRYGLVDRGFNWSQEGDDAGNPPWRSDQGIFQNQFTPFVSLYSLLDAVMDEAGFTWESDFFVDPASASPTQDMYMPCVNGNTYPEAEEIPTQNCAAINATPIFENSGGTQSGKMDLDDTISDAWDAGGNFSATNNRYTASTSGRYSIRFKLSVAGYDSTYTTRIRLWIYKNGNVYDKFYDLQLPTSPNSYLQTNTVTYTGYGNGDLGLVRDGIDLAENDYLEVYYQVDGYGLVRGGGSLFSNTCVFFVDDVSPANSEFDVDVAASLPEVKQIDFLVGLQKMFNLVFVPDKNKPNHLIIEPFQDYVATGTQYDWTSKVDYSKDVTIKPTTDLQKKETLWTYKKGGDFISDAVQKSLDRVYGEYKITEPSNDFAKGNQKIETTFGQYMMSLIPGMDIPIHRSVQADGQPVKKPLPMVAYWTGLSSAYGDWYLEDDISVTPRNIETMSELPIFSNYSDRICEVDSLDLNYGSERPFIPILANSANTLYFEYWAQYATELYANEARIMTCHMRLDNVDLAGFEFSDNIFIKDSYWRVLKMEYDANVEGLCKVELIKILSDVAICEDIPTGWDRAYQYVLFNDSDETAPDFGSKTCCERYGFEWVKVPVGPTRPGATSPMSLCQARLITTPPTQ